MTDLTEQWKKGELPEGWYWCECYNEEIKKLYYDGDCFELDDPETKNYYFFSKKDCAEIAILEEVPSYEEYLEMEGHCGAYSDINQWQKEEISAYKRLVAEVEHRNENLQLALKTYESPEIQKVLIDWRTGELDKKFNKLKAENTKLKKELKEICEKYLEIQTTVSAYEDVCKDLHAYIKQLKELLKEVLRHELSSKEVSELTRKISQVLGEENNA